MFAHFGLVRLQSKKSKHYLCVSPYLNTVLTSMKFPKRLLNWRSSKFSEKFWLNPQQKGTKLTNFEKPCTLLITMHWIVVTELIKKMHKNLKTHLQQFSTTAATVLEFFCKQVMKSIPTLFHTCQVFRFLRKTSLFFLFGLSSALLAEDDIFRFSCFTSRIKKISLKNEKHKFLMQNFQSQSLLRFIEMIWIIVNRFCFHQGEESWFSCSNTSQTFTFLDNKLFAFSSFVFSLCMLTTLDFSLPERVTILKHMRFGCTLLQLFSFFKMNYNKKQYLQSYIDKYH